MKPTLSRFISDETVTDRREKKAAAISTGEAESSPAREFSGGFPPRSSPRKSDPDFPEVRHESLPDRMPSTSIDPSLRHSADPQCRGCRVRRFLSMHFFFPGRRRRRTQDSFAAHQHRQTSMVFPHRVHLEYQGRGFQVSGHDCIDDGGFEAGRQDVKTERKMVKSPPSLRKSTLISRLYRSTPSPTPGIPPSRPALSTRVLENV
jgi:hypothetical protein